MGTSHYFILLSENPEFNEKIKSGIMIGPVIYMDNPYFKHFFRHIFTMLLNTIKWFGYYEAASSSLADILHQICTIQIYSSLCHRTWNSILNAKDDLTTSLVKMSNIPAGNALSIKNSNSFYR